MKELVISLEGELSFYDRIEFASEPSITLQMRHRDGSVAFLDFVRMQLLQPGPPVRGETVRAMIVFDAPSNATRALNAAEVSEGSDLEILMEEPVGRIRVLAMTRAAWSDVSRIPGRVLEGQRFRATKRWSVIAGSEWKAPFSGSFECVIPKGTRFLVVFDQLPDHRGFLCVPEGKDDTESLIVPVPYKSHPLFGSVNFTFTNDDIGNALEPLPPDSRATD